MSAKRSALLVLLVVVGFLTGCTSEPMPAPAVTVTVTAEPVTTETPVDVSASVPESAAEPVSAGLVFEALGEGEATVIWVADGAHSQQTVKLPFSITLVHDGYTAGVVQSGSGSIGCRLARGETVIDEKPVLEGQFYAECVLTE
ncbi:hypothetical protein [Microbacterium sp. GXF6406]